MLNVRCLLPVLLNALSILTWDSDFTDSIERRKWGLRVRRHLMMSATILSQAVIGPVNVPDQVAAPGACLGYS